MTIYFIDSSALVKQYVNEIGSAWILKIFDPSLNNQIFIAAVTGVEIVAAIARRTRGGSITTANATILYHQFRSNFQTDYQVVEITESVIKSAMSIAETYSLRGYDAIQLAAGCAINQLSLANNSSLTFVSADNELNVAALREGLVIENPNNHP